MPDIAAKVRLLTEQNLTTAQIAEQCGVRPSYVEKIQKRRHVRGRPLSVEQMIVLSDKLSLNAPNVWVKVAAIELSNELRKHQEGADENRLRPGGVEIVAGRGLS